ncbi:EutP/PduV family microcompartment system protein [Fictibacillus fluitans]|uniref:EutP/PduV family microcompartment system protein n=1 Tax=Fictibacillus fluitans TaxID=3058422 RepID=A0ABT8I1Q2_9BACL|nr:EutP/PduV family microcompartment system protein [Fictibacillus sp. NE201]MDN4526640.1 EutP/PduV family microcompartment system protein [Fictibacillus sp. NE201]
MNKKARAMLIGSIGTGKTSMTNALLGNKREPLKTQTLSYNDWIVDTPGEYTENPMFYKTIMATSLEVTHVIFLQDATQAKCIFPPGFSMGISKIAIGAVTKKDKEGADIARAVSQLRQAMPTGPIIITSSYTNEGLHHIRSLVELPTFEAISKYCMENSDNYLAEI